LEAAGTTCFAGDTRPLEKLNSGERLAAILPAPPAATAGATTHLIVHHRAGFAAMEKILPMDHETVQHAMRTSGLKVVFWD